VTSEAAAWESVPWREADHRNHPPERHHCRCRCEAMTDRLCPEHGELAPAADHHARLAAGTEPHPLGCSCGRCDADGFTDGSHAGSPRETEEG
jgi:hypothetical protein